MVYNGKDSKNDNVICEQPLTCHVYKIPYCRIRLACIQDTLSSRRALGLGRVRAGAKVSCIQTLGLKAVRPLGRTIVSCIQYQNIFFQTYVRCAPESELLMQNIYELCEQLRKYHNIHLDRQCTCSTTSNHRIK